MQRLKKLLDLPYVDEKNYERVCLYLLRMADYMSDPDDLLVRPGFENPPPGSPLPPPFFCFALLAGVVCTWFVCRLLFHLRFIVALLVFVLVML